MLDTDAAIQSLLPEWEALWHRAGRPPFQSPAWLLPWWAAFGTGQPRVAILRSGGMLRGVVALYVLDETVERKLLPIGVGVSDYFDALLDPAAPPDTAEILLHTVLARAKADAVTSCTLAELPPHAALGATRLPTGWCERPMAPTPCPVLTLPAAVPAGQLRNLRQSRHRADRCGGWKATVAEDAVSAWQSLMQMHRDRWSALGQPGGVLADPSVVAFHDAAVPRLAANDALQMQVLRIGETIAAIYYTLTSPGRLYFYLSGFDASMASASPGTVLLGALIEPAAEGGITELHFLRGAEAYKYAWGAVDRMNQSRLLLPAG